MGSEFVLVGADHRLILLGDVDAAEWPELTLTREVLEPHPPLGLWLSTGTHTGLVGICLRYRSTEPPLDSLVWPHHDVVRVYLASTTLQAIPPGGLGDVAGVTLPRPGGYVVRAAWSQRPREDHNDSADDGEERYLIDVWPA